MTDEGAPALDKVFRLWSTAAMSLPSTESISMQHLHGGITIIRACQTKTASRSGDGRCQNIDRMLSSYNKKNPAPAGFFLMWDLLDSFCTQPGQLLSQRDALKDHPVAVLFFVSARFFIHL